jgi:hypothetical protein
VVSNSTIDQGTLVRMNQKLGEFINPGNYEMEAAINVKDLSFVSVGDSVLLSSNDMAGNWVGKVMRISKSINPSTQTFTLFVSVSSSALKEGMFLNGIIKGNTVEQVVEIDRRLLVDNQYVYTIKDSALYKQPIEIKKFTSSAILASGIPENSLLLSQPISGAYEGLAVTPVKQ